MSSFILAGHSKNLFMYYIIRMENSFFFCGHHLSKIRNTTNEFEMPANSAMIVFWFNEMPAKSVISAIQSIQSIQSISGTQIAFCHTQINVPSGQSMAKYVTTTDIHRLKLKSLISIWLAVLRRKNGRDSKERMN